LPQSAAQGSCWKGVKVPQTSESEEQFPSPQFGTLHWSPSQTPLRQAAPVVQKSPSSPSDEVHTPKLQIPPAHWVLWVQIAPSGSGPQQKP
jgi:hypothetical protein